MNQEVKALLLNPTLDEAVLNAIEFLLAHVTKIGHHPATHQAQEHLDAIGNAKAALATAPEAPAAPEPAAAPQAEPPFELRVAGHTLLTAKPK